jgi:hypothetical protein
MEIIIEAVGIILIFISPIIASIVTHDKELALLVGTVSPTLKTKPFPSERFAAYLYVIYESSYWYLEF